MPTSRAGKRPQQKRRGQAQGGQGAEDGKQDADSLEVRCDDDEEERRQHHDHPEPRPGQLTLLDAHLMLEETLELVGSVVRTLPCAARAL